MTKDEERHCEGMHGVRFITGNDPVDQCCSTWDAEAKDGVNNLYSILKRLRAIMDDVTLTTTALGC